MAARSPGVTELGMAFAAPLQASARRPVQSPAMELLLAAAKPWAYWIAPLLLVSGVLAVLGYILMYVFKVVAAKYPKT